MALLAVHDLHVRLGESHVLQGVSFDVTEGGVTALLGRNGVGKTTTLRALMGLVPSAGTVELAGSPLAGAPTFRIVRRGVGYVPEDRDVFSALTVEENLRLAERDREPRYELVFELFPELQERAKQPAGTLSGGQQQMVAVARGLMAKPRILLLDEPSLGLAPVIVQAVFAIIAEIRRRGTTVLLVEQNARMGLSVADRGYVLETGKLVLSGTPDQLWSNEEIRAAYLGGRTAAA